MKKQIYYAIATCKYSNCGFQDTDYITAERSAISHSKKHRHHVTVDIGYLKHFINGKIKS